MTVERLKQYRSLRKEIEELAQEIKESEGPDVVEGSDDEWPYTKRRSKVRGSVCKPETLDIMRDKLAEIQEEYHELQKFIENIPDSETRRIFRLKYINGMTFQQIAFRLAGSRGESYPRRIHKSYMRKYNGKHAENAE